MTNDKALSVIQPRALTPDIWQMITEVAPAMHAARWFGVSNPEQAMAIMLKGHELGLGLAASFEFIKPVQGRPCLTPMGALALIQSSPMITDLEIEDLVDDKGQPFGCRVRMKRNNGFEYSCTFTRADAERAGLIRPDSGYDKYPANMYRWRAIGFCADVVCPDVLGGLKRADEMGAAISANGEVIEGSWASVPSQPATCPTAPSEPGAVIVLDENGGQLVALDDLLAQYGAEAIITANEGRIPGTVEELAAVAGKLTGREVDHG